MPTNDPTKRQLNLFVTHSVDTAFRDAARTAGYPKQPSPFLGVLTSMWSGDPRTVYRRIDQVRTATPDLFKSKESRFYLEQLRDLLNELLESK